MSHISGITDFLNQAGTQFTVFDMGRRIQPLEQDEFLAFEQGEKPYPYPLQQQAWLGFVVWNDDTADQELVIWFLRFPLDASGKLTAGIRDDFVLRLINKEEDKSLEENNPYGFKPKQEHMACFHAKAAKRLKQPASRFYVHAQSYFAGDAGYDQWAFVGFQGIADITARLDEDDNISKLCAALPQLPQQPLEALCQCLEHEILSEPLSQALMNRLDAELAQDQPNPVQISLFLRALSGSENQSLCQQGVQHALDHAIGNHAELLASVSGRCWNTLNNEDIMLLFLEKLASCHEGQEFFNLVIVDLINIPGMQEPLYSAVRTTERSETLAKAIGSLFQTFTQ